MKRRFGTWLIVTACVAGTVVSTGSVPTAEAAPGSIVSSGPLVDITTSDTLNCSVFYRGDTVGSFFGETACGTFVAVGGTLFGPGFIPAGGSLGTYTAFQPVSQTEPTGAGTVTNPYRVVTQVSLPGTNLTLRQTDLYVTGQQTVTTEVQLSNSSLFPAIAVLYRAGDCYVENNDAGNGSVTNGAVACVAQSGRVAQFVPLTTGSSYMEAFYSNIWAHIATRTQFPNTCTCDQTLDNGAGLSWPVVVPGFSNSTVRSQISFSNADPNLDSDGDGLLDTWEQFGYDTDGNGSIDLDLPAMGATADHKDLFIEVDWMERDRRCVLFWCTAGRSFAPNQAALGDVVAAFADAPLDNPDGTTGVRVHIDSGPTSVMNPTTGATWGSRSRATRVPHQQSLGSFTGGGSYDWTPFNTLQDQYFEQARRDVFHYALYADTYAGSGSSGIARGIPGDSFLVTDGHSSWNGGFTRRQEAGTFMHELGHTLALHHGGADPGLDERYKPNYKSIMNYHWQLSGTFFPRYIDYSRAALATLDENSLSELIGLSAPTGGVKWRCPNGTWVNVAGGSPLDWNCNGITDPNPVSVNLNGEGGLTQLGGANDWPLVVFDGGAVGAFGANNLDDLLPPPTETFLPEPVAQDFRDADLYANDGDGNVAFEGTNTLVLGAAGQVLSVRVSNLGTTSQTFSVQLSGTGTGVSTTPVSVTLAGGASQRVDVPVIPADMQAGTFTASAELSASATPVASGAVEITVVDPRSQEFIDNAPAVIDALRNGDLTDVPPDLADDLLAMLERVSGYAPLVPARLLETRTGPGLVTVDGLFQGGGAIRAGNVLTVQVTGRGNVPANATAAVINLTVTEPQTPGFVTVYPCDQPRPNASSINYTAGQTVANSVITRLAANGTICLYTIGTTHALFDVTGAYQPTAGYAPLVPARVLETRSGPGLVTVDGVSQGGGAIRAGNVLTVQVAGRGSVPANATAAVINLTVTEPQAPGFITVYPCDQPRPNASSINHATGQTIANGVITRLSATGTVCLFSLATTHAIIDVSGAYLPTAGYVPLVPARLLETRSGPGLVTVDGVAQGGGVIRAGNVLAVQVAGRGNAPGSATSAVINLTVTEPQAPGFVTVYPCDQPRPNASSINYTTGQTVANGVITRLAADGTVCLFSLGTTHAIVDINGYSSR